ncbi:hypothetical protein BISA_1185 [Bifidobacterium saguini DSM 23967]|uniref:DUF3027 family protein n=1 Tax=Bifidobacterium saguini DSM 23967 TaxID=1437607 RepID=A0A087DBX1_9BIFI|nr:hypothetical protein BISA_1185 [Bifidobacterium saguini DSM 23967]
MTDTIETTVTPDPRAIAHAVLLEVADEPEQVGEFVVANELEDHVTDFRFAANIRGYEGWQWSVTLYHDVELDSWTVNESSLIPTEDALMPPQWIPWKDRLEPTDLSPTDSIGTDPDDERLEPGEVEESSLQDVNDAAETFRLTRRHVLSPLGRAQAAKRWYEGPRGPKALSTKTAEGNLCSDCGFFVPLTGELDRMFGVCANKWSPDDGRVVSLDHGCGEHSEIEPPEPSHLWVQSKPALDDLHIDVIARPKAHKAEESESESESADVDGETVVDAAENVAAVADAPATESSVPSTDAVDGAGSATAQSGAKATDGAEKSGGETPQSTVVSGVADAQSSESASEGLGIENADSTEVPAATVANEADSFSGNDMSGDVAVVSSEEGETLEDNLVNSSDDADTDVIDTDFGEDDDLDDDEATEEDIINNTSVDTDDDDFDDDDSEVSDNVAPELETVIDLIEQLRQNRADEDSDTDADTGIDIDTESVENESGDNGEPTLEPGVGDAEGAEDIDDNNA